MASITIRQIEEALKKKLRLRAARSGRSVEDEVRTILREAADESGRDILEGLTPPQAANKSARRAAPAAGAKRVLLIIGGGIAAYKSLDLIRRLKERGFAVRGILTKAATHFVTPLSAGALLGERVFTDLFDPAGEFDVGHIRLARECDLVVVAPATADLMAKMANGHADDLATAVLLATRTKILLAPAMNPLMWANKATQRNLAQLVADGVVLVGPNEGEMAEAGERGLGRMAEPLEIAAAVEKQFARGGRARGQARAGHLRPDARADRSGALYRQPLVRQAGPRHRRGSGRRRRGRHAGQRAGECARSTGRFRHPRRNGARDARSRARRRCPPMSPSLPPRLPTGASPMPARRRSRRSPARRRRNSRSPKIPTFSPPSRTRKSQRPKLVIGFAAETENVAANAKDKLARKGCDWILANDVSPQTGIMGGDRNTIRARHARRRRGLAAAVEGGCGGDAGRADCCGAWKEMISRHVPLSVILRCEPTVRAKRGR